MSLWDLSCPDWETRIVSGKSLLPSMPLNNAAAQRGVAIFNRLRLADVVGNPTLGEAAGEWFRDIVRALFGSWDKVEKERYIREIFALVPKKNSKTSYGAGLMLTALISNERPNGKFILVAPTKDVTELAFSQAAGAIKLDPFLAEKFHIQDHIKKITDRKNGGTLEVMSFDPNVLTGQKPTGFLVDELHVMSSSAKAQSAVGQLRGGMIAQPEAFGIFISTQSERPPSGAFKAELDYARNVRDGKIKSRTLPLIYEFPRSIAKDKDAVRDPKNWAMVIPNNGRSITVDRLVEEFAGAQDRGDDEVRRWLSQHLNVEVGIALYSDRWAGVDYWETQGDKRLTLDHLVERSDVIVAGVDGGGMDDLLSLGVMGRDRATRNWLFWSRSWAHPVVLERRKSEAGRLKDFAQADELTIVDEVGQDIDQIADQIELIDKTGLLDSVGLDPMGIGAVVDALAERGIHGTDRIIGIPQGWQMAGSIKTAERKLADGTLNHGAQAIMTWAVSNAKVEPRGNAVTITKQVSGSAKIDPLMAMLNCVALMSRNPEARMDMSAFLDNMVIV